MAVLVVVVALHREGPEDEDEARARWSRDPDGRPMLMRRYAEAPLWLRLAKLGSDYQESA